MGSLMALWQEKLLTLKGVNNMRTVCTDILMICKGWGVCNISRGEALKDYIGLFTGCDSRDISDTNVLHFLSYSVKKFINPDKLIDALNRDAESHLYRDEPIIPFLIKLHSNLLIDRIITDLDLSDYDSIVKYCQCAERFADANNSKYFITGCKIRPWWRCFNEDHVEDDRK